MGNLPDAIIKYQFSPRSFPIPGHVFKYRHSPNYTNQTISFDFLLLFCPLSHLNIVSLHLRKFKIKEILICLII